MIDLPIIKIDEIRIIQIFVHYFYFYFFVNNIKRS